MDTILNTIGNIFENIGKFIYEYTILLVVFLFTEFLGVEEYLITLLIYVILIDMFAGVIKSIVVTDLHFDAKKLLIGFLSKISLLLLPTSVSLMLMIMKFDDNKIVVDVTMRLMIGVEVLSIAYNGYSIYKREDIESKDYLSGIYQAIIGLLGEALTKLTNILKNNAK